MVDDEDYELERGGGGDEDDEEQTIQELNEEDELSEHTNKPTYRPHNYATANTNLSYNSIKKNQHKQQQHPALNNNFQSELNTRLKSINNSKQEVPLTLIKNENNIYSKNYNPNSGTALKLSSSNNSTATTSISSASSCASNSDLVIGTSSSKKSLPSLTSE